MAFHDHLSHEMGLPQYTEQHLGEGRAVLRTMNQHGGQPFSSSSSDAKDGNDFHRLMAEAAGKPPLAAGGGGPTWLVVRVRYRRGWQRFRPSRSRYRRAGGDGNVSVLPVLGIGGVGKTTLAQLVYNDDTVKDYFSLRMWVCVSNRFNLLALTREISEQAGLDKDVKNFNRLQVNLQHKLTSERFLLVLDDVWNEEEEKEWDTLCNPLKFAKEGSKILVTSRSEKVARLTGTMEPIRLEGLQEEEFLPFFEERAFGCEDPGKHPKLAAIGKEIAKKLKGSPLAAETVGGLLKAKLDDDHWESILESRIWELPQEADKIMPVLKL